MRYIASLLFLLTLAHAQLKEPLDPKEASRLRSDEVVRFFKRGGRSVNGLYQALIVVKKDGTIIVKTDAFEDVTKQNKQQKEDFKEDLRYFDIKALTKVKRKDRYPPSASDGVDKYLSVRKNGKVYYWTNTKWEQGFATLFDTLEVYQYLARTAHGG